MRPRFSTILALALVATAAGAARADVKPHGLFTDNMVLQQGIRVPVWGTAGDDEKVTVRFLDQEVTANPVNGKWLLHLEPLKAGGPFTLTIKGKHAIELKNVLVGEVWVCSGQSNMEWPLSAAHNGKEAIADSANPQIRLYNVSKRTSATVQADVSNHWVECGPQTVAGFSAVGYFFGKALNRDRKVPVGLIESAWGGTPAEAWTGKAALEANPALKHYVDAYEKQAAGYPKALEAYKATAEKAKQENKPAPKPPQDPAASPHSAATLYNGMLAPLAPYGIKGAIWYQGESNAFSADRAIEYRTLLATMIRNWRRDFRQGDFPFLVVQLAPWIGGKNFWPELLESQAVVSQTVPNVGLAGTTDVGDAKDIHPRKKEPVGERLALAARAIAYGETIVFSGPAYHSLTIDGSKAVVTFAHVGGGLSVKGEHLTGFALAGEDRVYHEAKAEIVGNTVVVTCDKVPNPVAVRYGWAAFPVVNLYNKEGLPAVPFRTDDFASVVSEK